MVLGALQFLPETLNKRVRLVLHLLPLGEERVIGRHLLAGLLSLTRLCARHRVVRADGLALLFG